MAFHFQKAYPPDIEEFLRHEYPHQILLAFSCWFGVWLRR